MNWETLKHIYRFVLINKSKIHYHGDNKYTLTSYYPNGNPRWKEEYCEDRLHGVNQGWYENGSVLYKEVWKNGKLIK